MNTFKKVLTVFYFVFNLYAFGGGVMQGVVNYPAWKFIGTKEFPAFHQSIDSRIFVFFVPVFFLSVPISILMIWFGHPSISRRLIVLMALLNLCIFLVTIVFAIPIQNQLALEKSMEQIEMLIFYDRYFRIIPGFCGVMVTSLMLYQLQNRPATPAYRKTNCVTRSEKATNRFRIGLCVAESDVGNT